MKIKKYMITGYTNKWTASRDGLFQGKLHIVLERDLTLEDAKDLLLESYIDTCCAYYDTIEEAYEHEGNMHLYPDGTYSYECDGRHFYIEEQEEDEDARDREGKPLGTVQTLER